MATSYELVPYIILTVVPLELIMDKETEFDRVERLEADVSIVPLSFGRFIVLFCVGSITDNVVVIPSSVAPSNTKLGGNVVVFVVELILVVVIEPATFTFVLIFNDVLSFVVIVPFEIETFETDKLVLITTSSVNPILRISVGKTPAVI